VVLMSEGYELVEQKTGTLGAVLRHHCVESIPPFGGFLGVCIPMG